MGLMLFHMTLFVLMASILTSATCLSAYLVSRKRLMLFVAIAFLFYFLDIALIFQDEYIAYILDGGTSSAFYLLVRSLLSVVTGAGFLGALWLFLCDFLGETRRPVLIIPGIVFVVASVFLLMFVDESSFQRFWFYTLRMVYFAWMLLFAGFHYLTSKDEVEKVRLHRHRWMIFGIFILVAAVVVEDVYFYLIVDQAAVSVGPLTIYAERNYSEEALMMLIAVFSCRDAFRVLSLRFERPPMHGDERQEQRISENLMSYAKRHNLSAREREVLYLVLMGKDNQNIASSMQLALSTVKVHVRNILQKTGRTNRQDLIQDFWKTS